MIEYIKVTNHLGESITLELKNPENSGFFIRKIDGLGPNRNTINTSQSLSLAGGYYNSSKVDMKNLILDLGFLGNDGLEIETKRQELYRYFPANKKLTIEVKTDNRHGVISGYVEHNDVDIFSRQESTIISILCPYAYFIDKFGVETIFSGVLSAFEFPWENTSLVAKTLEFGQVFINTEANVIYEGDVDNGIVMYVTVLGAVNNLTISNVITGEVMAISSTKLIALTGSNLVAGDLLEISTVRGRKYIHLIRAGVRINILNTLSSNVSWFTLQRGDNVFVYTAASGVANLQFKVQHQLVYEGL